jgi:hypothetical protein
MVQSQPRQTVMRPYLEKNPLKKWVGGVVQGVGPEFKLQNYKKKKTIGWLFYAENHAKPIHICP